MFGYMERLKLHLLNKYKKKTEKEKVNRNVTHDYSKAKESYKLELVMQRQNNYLGAALAITETMLYT